MKLRAEYTCPLEMTHDIIRGKWKPIILWQLGRESASLSQLKRDIKGINQKMLLEQLGELQDFGMVSKESFAGYPRRVSYALTSRGQKLLSAISIMQGIGVELMQEHGMDDVLRAAGFIAP